MGAEPRLRLLQHLSIKYDKTDCILYIMQRDYSVLKKMNKGEL